MYLFHKNYIQELKAEQEKPQEPSIAEIKPNKKILIELKVEKKPLGVIVVGGKNNHVKVRTYIEIVFVAKFLVSFKSQHCMDI